MSVPGFFAQQTLYRTTNFYRAAIGPTADTGDRVSPAILKGTYCVVQDPECPSGRSKLFCPSFDPDDCRETGVCCTPRPPPPPGNPNCIINHCPPGVACCKNGCCPPGGTCCGDDFCCKPGWKCRDFPFAGKQCVPF
jgi:hypothetical protein